MTVLGGDRKAETRVCEGDAAEVAELRAQNDRLRERVSFLEYELDRNADQSRADVGAAAAAPPSAPRADPLTGLATRDVLVERLDHCIARSRRTEEHFALLFCDLDGFKFVNDLYGHEVGDAVLVEVSARLERTVRPYDTVARFGGDEFVILLEGQHSSSDAPVIAQRLVDEMSSPIIFGDCVASVGISIGVADSSQETASSDELIARADAAMYEAKRAGKHRVAQFGRDLDRRLSDRRELSSDLRRALDDGQLVLLYRPVVSLDDGQVASVEASLRWNHPTRGMLGPDVFLPIAYATGLIEHLDEWILSTAATDMARWRVSNPGLIGWVTLSTRLLIGVDGADRIGSILEAANAEQHSVGIEIDEASLQSNYANAANALVELAHHKVLIALDNFAGQLTVRQLHAIVPHTVKLHRDFMAQLGRDPRAAAEVRSITGMTRPLGIATVAKGVDTPEQLAAVIALNCDHAQGAVTGEARPWSELDLASAAPKWGV
ncbi:MAG TPA: EAL domain-containing protein [Acidimicrobiia bacterium]|jgi:diguanylate cyclase (GGDEF)-like protein